MTNRVDICNALIQRGAKLGYRDVANMTPLHYAISRNYSECARLLQRFSSSLQSQVPMHAHARPSHMPVRRERRQVACFSPRPSTFVVGVHNNQRSVHKAEEGELRVADRAGCIEGMVKDRYLLLHTHAQRARHAGRLVHLCIPKQ